MLVSVRMARAFSKMALKSSMDAFAGSPSRCLKNKIKRTEPPTMLVSGRMASAFSKMALKSSMDTLAGSPSRCLKNKINENRATHNVGVRPHG